MYDDDGETHWEDPQCIQLLVDGDTLGDDAAKSLPKESGLCVDVDFSGKVEPKPKVRRGHGMQGMQGALAVCCLVVAARAGQRAHACRHLTAVLHACGGKWQASTPKSVTPRGEAGREPRKSCPSCKKVCSSPPLLLASSARASWAPLAGLALAKWCRRAHARFAPVHDAQECTRAMCAVSLGACAWRREHVHQGRCVQSLV